MQSLKLPVEQSDLLEEIRSFRVVSERQTKATEDLALVCGSMASAVRDMRAALHSTNTTNLELAGALRETRTALQASIATSIDLTHVNRELVKVNRDLVDELTSLRSTSGGNGHAHSDEHLIDDGDRP